MNFLFLLKNNTKFVLGSHTYQFMQKVNHFEVWGRKQCREEGRFICSNMRHFHFSKLILNQIKQVSRTYFFVLYFSIFCKSRYPANILSSNVNSKNTRKRCEICSKLAIKTPGQYHWRFYCCH